LLFSFICIIEKMTCGSLIFLVKIVSPNGARDIPESVYIVAEVLGQTAVMVRVDDLWVIFLTGIVHRNVLDLNS
jgi:hypothetical protein